MEGGSLFNPGFLGASFNWWVGQIATDSAWRDNILTGKYEDRNLNPGWGYRYKVRIIGLHDQGETEIPSDQLPWAQVMYPVTGGGGQGNSVATANLRQGMMVFGFFLDGQEQQVPVIMGVLGNNIQTPLSTTIGGNRVTNTQPGSLATSGKAVDSKGNTNPHDTKVPDHGIEVVKPGVPAEAALLNPFSTIRVDKYGLPFGQATPEQLQDIQSSSAQATQRGLTGDAFDAFVKEGVLNGIRQRVSAASSPTAQSRPGATIESVDGFHKLTRADVVLSEYYNKKTELMSPCDMVKSALKAIQIVLDNLTKDIDKVLNTALAYIDAASNLLSSIQNLISNAACVIAKYMKIIFDKIMEYILKQINKGLAPTVEQLPLSMRHRYFDLKTTITELITCLYNKITNNLCGLIQGLLDKKISKQLPPKRTRPNGDEIPQTPFTPICSVEQIAGDTIALNMRDMSDTINSILNNVNKFLNDIQRQIGNVADAILDVKSLISGINGSITSALSFENIKLNIFGCDLKPNCATSDYYTIQGGGAASEQPQQPRPSQVDLAAQGSPTAPRVREIPYALPSQNQPDIDFKAIQNPIFT